MYRIDGLEAYYFDRAIALFGAVVEEAIAKAQEGKEGHAAEHAGKLVLAKWNITPERGLYADPAAMRR